MRPHRLFAVAFAASACVVHVDGASNDRDEHARGEAGDPALGAHTGASDAGARPSDACNEDADAGASFRVMTWNVEWFGDRARGPTNEERQEDGIVALLARRRPDVLALQEVADAGAFARLVARVPGTRGIVASTPGPQRLALLLDSARFEVVDTTEIHGLDDAGRPPLRVILRDRVTESRMLVVVIHAKAGRDATDWERRRAFAEGLARALADTSEAVIVLGDFNDRIGDAGSIVEARSSPFDALLDTDRYATPTAHLDAASTAWGANVDHIVLGDSLATAIRPESVEVLREDALAHAPAFLDEVSDHFPVTLELAP
jgi:endonuclease/exonuclease/phosphatase family metal-dependent hydrolase